jgi:serine/threonine-protein kinase
LRERFLREIRTAAGLSHPNIVPIYNVEERNGLVFFAMGYVDGETLSQRLQRTGPLPASDVARLVQDAAWALAYAHGRGIVHRDVKPDNILIERASGRAFLTDFGIAHVANSTMTAVGASLGTPQFMSPEQAAGESVDARSDLYSLGLVAYVALAGSNPFDAPTVQSILAKQVTMPAPPIAQARPGLPPKLAEVVDRCLAKSSEERFASGDELVTAIQGAQGNTVPAAPQVRFFQRAASMSIVQLWIVAVAMLMIADVKPTAANVAAFMWLVLAIMTMLQIVMRARHLLDQGFSYSDVRALFAQDEREQRELDELAKRRPSGPATRVKPGVAISIVGGVLIATGITVAELHTQLRTPKPLALTLVVIGAIMVPIGMQIRRASSGRESRLQQRINRLWMGRVGRGLFQLAGWRLASASPELRGVERPGRDAVEQPDGALPAVNARSGI